MTDFALVFNNDVIQLIFSRTTGNASFILIAAKDQVLGLEKHGWRWRREMSIES